MFVLSYDCFTAAGEGPQDLMKALESRTVYARPALPNEWNEAVVPGGLIAPLTFQKRNGESATDYLNRGLTRLWKKIVKTLPPEIQKSSRVGLVFASTKGSIEDTIYKTSEHDIRQCQQDPYTPVIENFKKDNLQISFEDSFAVSNACSSSHVALEVIQNLFDSQKWDYALLLAADLLGPFVYNGFHSLKVLSQTQNRPFAAGRDGLQLGEAMTALFISKNHFPNCEFKIERVASETEGSSITRPSVKGQGLIRTLEKLKSDSPVKPDLVIAHGTGTQFNDAAEDLALFDFLNKINSPKVPITGTKWCIGHTLGASGAVDLIAGCEVLKSEKIFSLSHKDETDSQFKMNYLRNSDSSLQAPRQIILTSLGFGGVHASLLLKKVAQK